MTRTVIVATHTVPFTYSVTFQRDGVRVERLPYSAHNMMLAVTQWLNQGTIRLAIFEGADKS